jgi:NADH dehydrogenase
MTTPRIPHILILGGGYVAIYVLKRLRRALRRGEIAVTVIDPHNYHTFHGLVPELLVGKIQAAQIISPARRLFAPARFICAEVDAIDAEKKEVRYLLGEESQPHTITYDHVVINLGTVDNLSHYRGVGEHTLRLKNYLDCLRIRHRLLAMLERAEAEPDPEERRRLLHFVIAGGNYAGIEVAAELAEFLDDLTRHEFRAIDPEECQISIVHSGQQILPELGKRFPSLSEHAASVLRKRGVSLELGVRLQAATPAEALLSDGRRLATRTIISCTGSAKHPLLANLPFERDQGGRLVTDTHGRVSAEHHVWSAGDCAAVPLKNGSPAPALALYAMKGGELIGDNILASVRAHPLRPHHFNGFGDCCVLGKRNAVGRLWNIPLKGIAAYYTWCACMVLYLPDNAKRVRTLFDWFTNLFFGREITSAGESSSMGVGTEIYEPGQTIIKQGDVGHAMYIIQSGRVEVVAANVGSTKRLAELGPGQHFGEISVLKDVLRTATVRALEPSTLLRISRENTRQLSGAFQPFAEMTTARLAPAETSASS